MGSLKVAKTPKLINERTEKLVFPFVHWSRAYHEGYSLWGCRELSQRLHLDAERSGPCAAAEKCKQFPPSHSITSSARARRAGDSMRPSVLAVFKLMTSSNSVGCSMGN